MKKNLHLVVFLAALMAALLSACGPNAFSPEVMKAKGEGVICTVTEKVIVKDTQGGVLRTFEYGPYEAHFEWNYGFTLVPNKPILMAEFYAEVNASLDKLNQEVGRLVLNNDVVEGIKIPALSPSQYRVNTDYTPDCPNGPLEQVINPFLLRQEEVYPHSYSSRTEFTGETVYVTVSSPMGSSVKYRFPVTWIDQIFATVFTDGENLVLNSQKTVSSEIAANEEGYAEALLKTLLGEGDLIEVIALKFNADDFAGRQELWPVVAKALEISQAQVKEPGQLVIKAFMATGEVAAGEIEGRQNGFTISGWSALTFGGISGSGGGGSLQGSYTASFENMVSASIYWAPVSK